MKVLVARVKKGEVVVAQEVVSFIGKGLTLFAAIEKDDDHLILEEMAEKIVNLRIFEDEDGKMNYSARDKDYQILCIPNFTLCANTEGGRRPSFENSMPYVQANKLFDDFILILKSKGINVEAGVFGAYMDIRLDLNGPVNIMLESDKEDKG